MKKRQRVVRSEAGATNTAAATTTTSSLPAVEGATPQVSIPTLDIFSRFQSRRDDFEADWMMLHDDVSTESKPIGTDVAQRLAAHRDQLGDLRRQRAAEASTSSASPQVGVAHQANVDDDDDDDDEADYQPEEVGAAQYAAATTATTSNTEDVEEGLQGDYLDFSSRVPSTNNNNNSSNNASAAAMPLWCATRIERFGAYSANPLIALHQELTDVLDFLRPTEMEVVLRRYVELNVCAIAKTLWPECEPIVYGSMLTQLVLPLSDIDLTLLNVPVSQEEALTAVAREVSRRGLCEEAYPQVILKTKVPLVKFQHKGSLIDVDISVGAGDGQRNSDMVVRLLRQYPEARPLIIIIKYFLLQRDMHEPYHGGLGSYATTLLVISFLQHHPITTTNREERAYSGLGRLLVDFFRYAGQYWNYNKCGISVDGRGRNFVRNDGGGGGSYRSPTSPNSPRSPMGPPQAIIEDPGNATNNAASSLRNYNMISSVFSHAYLSLTANFSDDEARGATSLDAVDLAQRPTLLSRILHVDRRLVEQRQRVARVYQHMMQTQPEELEAARHYREEEDQSMLAGGSPTTGERQTLATLSAAAAKMAASSSSSSLHKRKRSLSSSSSNGVVGSSSSSDDDDDEDEGSNASSIRVEVAPQRRKRE